MLQTQCDTQRIKQTFFLHSYDHWQIENGRFNYRDEQYNWVLSKQWSTAVLARELSTHKFIALGPHYAKLIYFLKHQSTCTCKHILSDIVVYRWVNGKSDDKSQFILVEGFCKLSLMHNINVQIWLANGPYRPIYTVLVWLTFFIAVSFII